MMDLYLMRERQEAIRREVARQRLAVEAGRVRAPRRLRVVLGTSLARAGLRLAGPAALRAALGEAR